MYKRVWENTKRIPRGLVPCKQKSVKKYQLWSGSNINARTENQVKVKNLLIAVTYFRESLTDENGVSTPVCRKIGGRPIS